MRKAFTLIEMMIAIVIFSVMVIFLYRSYGSLERSNAKYEKIEKGMERFFKVKKTLFLDFSLAVENNITILNQDRNEDVVFVHTSNSLHNRFDPYVAYVVKEGVLYRIESLRPFREYPFGADTFGDVDKVASIKRFRVYKALKKENGNIVTLYLIDAVLKNGKKILYKVRRLNQD